MTRTCSTSPPRIYTPPGLAERPAELCILGYTFWGGEFILQCDFMAPNGGGWCVGPDTNS